MTLILRSDGLERGSRLAADMHRDRKHVFVDLLGWDVPVVAEEFEVDQFDHPSALYLVSADADDRHRGSIRLLPTDKPHILGSLFPHLCEAAVPSGPNIYEITRGCLSPRLRASERLRVRNQLTTAAVAFARVNQIDCFTCVADGGWYSQILALGWQCEPLGLPRLVGGSLTGALLIRIDATTQRRLAEAGTYAPSDLRWADYCPALAA